MIPVPIKSIVGARKPPLKTIIKRILLREDPPPDWRKILNRKGAKE